MTSFNVPPSPQLQSININNFMGVDFTTEQTELDVRRSSNAYNMINVDGYNEKRAGYKSLIKILGNINGVWNIDKTDEELLIAHIGNSLYEIKSDFSSYIKLTDNLNNRISTGIIINGKLYLFDGKRAIVYGNFGGTWKAKYLDEIGRIPTTVISRSPSRWRKTIRSNKHDTTHEDKYVFRN